MWHALTVGERILLAIIFVVNTAVVIDVAHWRLVNGLEKLVAAVFIEFVFLWSLRRQRGKGL